MRGLFLAMAFYGTATYDPGGNLLGNLVSIAALIFGATFYGNSRP